MSCAMRRTCGFTLIELLTALLILSILGLLSYRGLDTVLETRRHVSGETERWRSVAAFFTRFERDVQLAAPRAVRDAPAFHARREGAGAAIELTRAGSSETSEPPRRVAYALNAQGEVELWLWPVLDAAPQSPPQRYRVLAGVQRFEIEYLTADRTWTGTWPARDAARALPLAVRVRVVLASGEDLVRVFALA